jgi:hypothetical protein
VIPAPPCRSLPAERRLSARRYTAVWLALMCFGCGEPAGDRAAQSVNRPVRLYVAAGQSNMVGFGAFAEARHRVPHQLIRYRYRTATGAGLGPLQTTPSFFRHGSIREGISAFRDRGAGPWWAFAQELAKQRSDAEIRILMLAVNGSSLTDWCQDGGLLDQSIAFIREETSRGATLEGIIWHQGEAGVGSEAGDYGPMLAGLIHKLRSETGAANLPFVAATLPDKSPHAAQVNAALDLLGASLPALSVVDGHHATMSDAVHLDTAASEALGIAMAEAMMHLSAPYADAQ